MLVMFDIDDTLVDHTAAVRAGVGALHEAARPTASLEALYASWHAAMIEHFPRYLRGELTYEEQRRARLRQTVAPSSTDSEADRLFDCYFEAYQSAWALFPDALACLTRLEHVPLGIISNGNGAEQRRKLERTGIAEHFQIVHISSERGYAKPAPELFLGACSAAGVAPQLATYVGDLYETDAVGARRAGLRGIWLNRSDSLSPDREPPMIRGLDEVPELVRAPL